MTPEIPTSDVRFFLVMTFDFALNSCNVDNLQNLNRVSRRSARNLVRAGWHTHNLAIFRWGAPSNATMYRWRWMVALLFDPSCCARHLKTKYLPGFSVYHLGNIIFYPTGWWRTVFKFEIKEAHSVAANDNMWTQLWLDGRRMGRRRWTWCGRILERWKYVEVWQTTVRNFLCFIWTC